MEILVYLKFFIVILKTNMFSHHLSKSNFILNFDF